MRVYEVHASEDHEEFLSPAGPGTGLLDGAPGVLQAARWSPPAVVLVREEDGNALAEVDCPYLPPGDLIVLKDAALPRVADVLLPYAEFLALDCPQAPLTAVNVLNVVDALDEEHTEAARFPDGRLMLVDRYAFHPDRVPMEGLFKIPQYLGSATFCTQPTAELLTDRLTRLHLLEVWRIG